MIPPERARAGGVELPVPDGWSVIHPPRTLLAIATGAPSSGFRPNIVVTAEESDALIPDASTAALETIYAYHPGARVFSVEVWPGPDHPARVVVFTYPAGETEVVVQQYVWATGRRVVTLSASCATYQYAALDRLFAAVATEARVSECA